MSDSEGKHFHINKIFFVAKVSSQPPTVLFFALARNELFSSFFFISFYDSRDFLIFKATHLPNHRSLVVAIQISVIMPSPVHSTPVKGRILHKHILLRFRSSNFLLFRRSPHSLHPEDKGNLNIFPIRTPVKL